jgi:hypothetical protein
MMYEDLPGICIPNGYYDTYLYKGENCDPAVKSGAKCCKATCPTDTTTDTTTDDTKTDDTKTDDKKTDDTKTDDKTTDTTTDTTKTDTKTTDTVAITPTGKTNDEILTGAPPETADKLIENFNQLFEEEPVAAIGYLIGNISVLFKFW